MTLDLSLIEHPQLQNASPPIGCLKELLNYHWLLLKICAETQNMLCPTWVHRQSISGPFLAVAKRYLFLLG
jgi:hypothetical protein